MEHVIAASEALLKALYGEDILKDPNFTDTPKRMARAYKEMLDGDLNGNIFERATLTLKGVSFPTPYKGIILSPKHRTFSMCPHHMLPVIYDVTIAYFPTNQVAGASKLARFTDLLAHRAVLQETFTDDLISGMNSILHPKGVAVFVKGVHMCMQCRGVKTQAPYITQKLSGIFIDNEAVRHELVMMLKNGD